MIFCKIATKVERRAVANLDVILLKSKMHEVLVPHFGANVKSQWFLRGLILIDSNEWPNY